MMLMMIIFSGKRRQALTAPADCGQVVHTGTNYYGTYYRNRKTDVGSYRKSLPVALDRLII